MKKSIWFYLFLGISIVVCLMCLILSVYYVVTSIRAIITLAKYDLRDILPNYVEYLIQFGLRAVGCVVFAVCTILLTIHTYGKSALSGKFASYEDYCEYRAIRSKKKKENARRRLIEKLERINR